MDHVGHSPHQVDGVERRHRLGAVGQGYGDPVAGAHADGLERPGTEVDLLYHDAVGGLASHEHIGRIVWVLLGAPLHRLVQGAVGVVQLGGNISPESQPGGLYLKTSLSIHSRSSPLAAGPAAPD